MKVSKKILVRNNDDYDYDDCSQQNAEVVAGVGPAMTVYGRKVDKTKLSLEKFGQTFIYCVT